MKKKRLTQLLFVIAVFFLGIRPSLAAVANPPESLPATPTHDASKVLSLYSDFYTPNVVGISSFTNISGATISGSQLSVLGDNMIYLEKALNPWSFINFDKSIDIDEYDALYADIYVIEGETPVKVMFKSSDNVNTYNFVVATLQEGWNKVEIKLDDFRTPTEGKVAPNFKDVVKIGFINNKGSQRSIYIDNLYAYSSEDITIDPKPDPESDVPTNSAPNPTQDADIVTNIFSDAYLNSSNITFSGTGTGSIETLFGNDNMIKLFGGMNSWANVHFSSVDFSEKETLHIDIYTFRTSAGKYKLKLNATSNEVIVSVNGGWNSFDIPISDFAGASSQLMFKDVTQLCLIASNGYAQNIYIDNIYAYGKVEAPELDATAPSVSAPLPTMAAGNVLSVFSNAYTTNKSISSIDGAGTGIINMVVGTDEMIKLVGLEDWININFGKAANITNYATLHTDVYIPGETGTVDLKFKLSSGNEVARTLNEGWNSVDIKVSEFDTDLSAINKLSLCNSKAEVITVYVDNIYVYGLPAAAPVPTRDASEVKSIFSDAYSNLTEIKDFSGTGTASIITPFEEDNVINLVDGLNMWAYINLSSEINLSNMGNLHLDVFVVRESGTINLKIKFDDGIEVKRTLSPGWNSLDIPMSEFKDDPDASLFTTVNKLHFIREGGYAQTVYIDNIYTYGINGEEVPPVDPKLPTVAAPVPEHEAKDVVSIFSDTYENVTTLTQSNPGSPAATMDVVTRVEGDNLLRFSSLNWTLIKIDPAIDLSDMDYLHYDVWVPSGTPRLIYGLSDGTTEGRVPEYKIEKSGTWVSVDVPLNAFKDTQDQEKQGPLTGLKQLRIFSASGFAVDRLYYDNIYAFKGESPDTPTYEIESAYEPIMAPETVKPIYTEKSVYKNITDLALAAVDGTTEFKFINLRAGDESVMRMFSLDKAVVTALTPINVDDMEYIHFNIYKNVDVADASLKIGFQAAGSENVYYADEVLELKDKDWVYYNISIDALKKAGLDCTAIENIVFEGKGNLYVDNIFAFKGEYTLGLGEEGKVSVDWEAAAEGDVLPDIDTPLIGVNLASACGGSVHGKIGTEYFYPSFKDLYYFKSKGVRLFRFPFRWERIQHELNGDLDLDSDIQEMKKVIAEAERLGMYVMIDMHNYCRYTINGTKHTLGEGVLTQEHMADVWKKLAAEFKDYKNIWGYDIQNEPYGLQKGVWLNAAQAIINAIREVDTKTAIVVEGESYASSSTWPTTGGHLIDLVDPADNLIFQAHCYFDLDKSGLYKYGDYDKEVRSSNQHISRLKPYVDWLKTNNKKGILGEFGVPRNDVRWLIMLDEVLTYLKENGVSGTYWVAGTGYDNDHVSVQPKNLNKDNITSYFEPAQMRILQEYFPVSEETDIQSVNGKDNVISIYPNPVLNNININSEFGIERIQIFNMSGNLVKESVLGGVNQTNVNVENLTSGIYMVHILCSNGNVETQKMVKL